MTITPTHRPAGGCGGCRPVAGCLYCARLTPVLSGLARSLPLVPVADVPDDVVDAALSLFAPDALDRPPASHSSPT